MMRRRLGDILRSLLVDWPDPWPHKVAAALVKAALIGVPFLALVLVGPPLVPVAVWTLVVVVVILVLLLVLINTVLRLFPERERVARQAPMPRLEGSPVDLVRLLGPYNSQEGLRLYDAAFEGGGVKAIAQIGAVARLAEAGLRPRRIVGASGGAIVGAALAAGATPQRLWDMLAGIDLTELLDPRWLPNRRWLRRAFYGLLPLLPGLLVWKAAVRGRRFREIVLEQLRDLTKLDDPTFGDLWLRRAPPGSSLDEFDSAFVATDITRRRALVLPRDSKDFGIDHAALSVADAVRMSMAIPFVFEPVRLPLADSGVTADIVDGGVSSNYPIWWFDSTSKAGPRYPTFGFLLDESAGAQAEPPQPVRWLYDYAASVVQAGIGAIDRILDAHDEARTIRIPTLGVATTDFDLSPERQAALFASGYRAADEFLQRFDWAQYVKDFRGARARIPGEAAGEAGVVGEVEYGR
jgi:NTE family protein